MKHSPQRQKVSLVTEEGQGAIIPDHRLFGIAGDGKTLLQSNRTGFSESVGGSHYKSLVLAHGEILGALSREVAEAIKTVSKK